MLKSGTLRLFIYIKFITLQIEYIIFIDIFLYRYFSGKYLREKKKRKNNI